MRNRGRTGVEYQILGNFLQPCVQVDPLIVRCLHEKPEHQESETNCRIIFLDFDMLKIVREKWGILLFFITDPDL